MTSVNRKHYFDLPDGVIYLDGNSLGPLPNSVNSRVAAMMSDEWGDRLIRGWNDAGWMEQPVRVGNMIAGLIEHLRTPLCWATLCQLRSTRPSPLPFRCGPTGRLSCRTQELPDRPVHG